MVNGRYHQPFRTKEVRRFMLATNDAHSLYEKFGFNPIDKPELFMQKVGKTPFQQ